ncbi:breast carcinoma-amplified sequence 1 isoform X3 [Thunnus maccoyii]|uniref:breast carcinoma-amplified sequence 1 isoform X3 n=1 Tax=Thunnus maccoyii TaxID=8240 RepID=UPI001C4AFA74|nr:breast carcinoma-amplified sequence 1 isoform X3 [Thunnus maccoyii]
MGNEHSKNKELTKNGKIPEKHENGVVNGISANITSNGLEIGVNGETIIQQNAMSTSSNPATESNEQYVIVESNCQHVDAQVISDTPDTTVQKEEEEKKRETSNEDQTDASLPATNPQPEAENLKQESESLKEPESATLDPSPEEEKAPETDDGNSQPVEKQEESKPEENPVMNFFKTLVTPTKTTKKETATPDATKDQSEKENQPAPTTTVAQVSEPPAAAKGMSIPPPPPPEPPKMEVKGEPAAKPIKPTPQEEPKAAAKEPESSKGKSAKDTLSKFFRPKTIKAPLQQDVEVAVQQVVEVQETPVEEPEPVVEVQKVDPSKAGTLEAAAKPEPPPPVQEEKKPASKPSFFSLFKPKAAEPKKATPAPAAAAEGAQTVKAKEEPKGAAKSSEAAADNKPASVASQAGDDAANVPKKLEKRNSIQLFFKALGQKRHSTDAGVQTEPVVVAPAAEKAK